MGKGAMDCFDDAIAFAQAREIGARDLAPIQRPDCRGAGSGLDQIHSTSRGFPACLNSLV
jgi:hypothetical protein